MTTETNEQEELKFNGEDLDVEDWDIVIANGEKYIAIVNRDGERLKLWPCVEYAQEVGITPQGEFQAKRQVLPVDGFASLPVVYVPNTATRIPIKGFESQDQAAYLKMLGGVDGLRDQIRAHRGKSGPDGGPRIKLVR